MMNDTNPPASKETTDRLKLVSHLIRPFIK